MILNLKGSMGSRVAEERCELQQSSSTTGTTRCCQGEMWVCLLISSHTRSHTNTSIKTKCVDHTYWFVEPKVFPENPAKTKRKKEIHWVIVAIMIVDENKSNKI